jgi:RimJ/RimL family protein N-acetyltransferase
MEEATTATLDYIFNQTPITLVEASNAQSNAGSRKVKIKNGFKFIEVRTVELRPGKVQDPIQEVYHLTKAYWLALK